MKPITQKPESDCPSYEIASYIDGEFDTAREREIETHFASCPSCANELSQQRQFLCSLNASLKNEGELELPANFTKRIVANAESTVIGLRRPRERFNALFICAGLALFTLFTLGAEAGNVFGGFVAVVDKVSAVGSFFAHFVYSILIGLMVIVRSLSSQFQLSFFMSAAIIALLTLTALIVSRMVIRLSRV